MLTQKYMIWILTASLLLLFSACNAEPAPTESENPKTNYRIAFPTQTDDAMPYPRQNVEASPYPIQTATPDPVAVNETIGSFSTRLIDRDTNRVDNIKLAARRINNYVLMPGKEFSFNGIVGDRDRKHGYKNALILIDGEKEEGIGGGICQLSSTLYNAAQRAGLKVLERHTHSGEVLYVPKGSDAAVVYGNLDLRFVNTRSFPVKLKVAFAKGKLSVKILRAAK